MSEIINRPDEPGEDENIENYITLTDDDGEDVSFEIIGTVTHKERTFAVLLPFDDEDGEVVILEILPGETPDSDEFISVDDDSLLQEVFELFKKDYDGDYEFE